MRLMNTPRSMEISITPRCNLRCRYCSHFSSASDVDQDLRLEDWLDFFDELGRNAVMDVTLEGGEPFLRQDLAPILDGIVKNRMRFGILTNGTLIDDAIVHHIETTRRCNQVQVSIDGSRPETHDRFRGEGSFERAIQGIRLLQRHGVPVSVRVTVHKHNVDDLEATARMLLEELGLPGFSTNSASFMGLCRAHADEVRLDTAQRTDAMATLLRLQKRYPGRISAAAGPLAEAVLWMGMTRALREGREAEPGRGFLSGCGGVMSGLAVRPDGAIIPCIQLSHMELGRINRDDIKGIWQDHPALARLRVRTATRLGDFEFCRGCVYIPYCTGGCPATAYTMMHDENHPSPEGCLKRFLEDGGRLPDEPER